MTDPRRETVNTTFRATRALTAIAAIALAAACTGGQADGTAPAPTSPGAGTTTVPGGTVLRVLAGSELADMQPVLDGVEERTGVEVRMQFTGTLAGTQLVADGGADAQYDATWFPSDHYLALLDGGPQALVQEERIMSSPVVLGISRSAAERLGWTSSTPAWNDVVTAVDEGELTFGMTSPVASNSGFSTLIEAATALSGTGTVLRPEDVATVTPALQRLFAGQELTAGSSGYLLSAYTADTDAVDGLFNYESVLQGVTVDGEPLVTIAPSDGVVTADYPLSLLASATGSKAAYEAVVADLRTPRVQQQIADLTHRRTSATTNPTGVWELPFPNRLDTVQSLVQAYLGQAKPPSDVVLATDVSGSMEGANLTELQGALRGLADTSTPSRSFTAFQSRETVHWLQFNDRVVREEEFSFDEADREPQLQAFRTAVDGLRADGGTAIYDTLEEAYDQAADLARTDPGHHVSVTLFTDGENTDGDGFGEFSDWYRSRPVNSPVHDIPVFVIAFGSSDRHELEELAALTGGEVFAGDTGDGLAGAFGEIRGYQ